MKLPEITQEILDKFGASGGVGTQLIEWRCSYNGDMEPQWTQTAVDFACLIAQGEGKIVQEPEHEMDLITWQKNRITELEAEIEDIRSLYGTSVNGANDLMKEIERMRLVEKGALEYVNMLHRGQEAMSKKDIIERLKKEATWDKNHGLENIGRLLDESADTIKELESAGRALLEWDKKYPKGVTYNSVLYTRCENELTALIERFRALLEPITSEDK